MLKNLKKLKGLLALLVFPLCAGCGGGVDGADDDQDHARRPVMGASVSRLVCDAGRCHRYVAVFLDAADEADVREVRGMPFVYSADIIGVLVGTDQPNATAVGLWVADTFGTPYATVRVTR